MDSTITDTITLVITAVCGFVLITLGAGSNKDHSKQRLIPIGFGFMLLCIIFSLFRILELLRILISK